MLIVNGNDVLGDPNIVKLEDFFPGHYEGVRVIYGHICDFKTVVHHFSANGAMKDSIMQQLLVGSVQELRDGQEYDLAELQTSL